MKIELNGEMVSKIVHEEPDNDKVICPQCCHQFRAIPENVQKLLLTVGFEPPFIAAAEKETK